MQGLMGGFPARHCWREAQTSLDHVGHNFLHRRAVGGESLKRKERYRLALLDRQAGFLEVTKKALGVEVLCDRHAPHALDQILADAFNILLQGLEESAF